MTGFIVSVFPFRNRVSSKEAFEGLDLGEGNPSPPVLGGPGGRKAAWLRGTNASGLPVIQKFPPNRHAGDQVVAGELNAFERFQMVSVPDLLVLRPEVQVIHRTREALELRICPQRTLCEMIPFWRDESIRSGPLEIPGNFLNSVEWAPSHPSFVQAHKGAHHSS
jgi:hypothetical protein